MAGTGRAQESPRGCAHDDQQPALHRGPRHARPGGPGRRHRHGTAGPAPRPGAPVVARRQRRRGLVRPARGDGPVGRGGRHPAADLGLRRAAVDRAAHRPHRLGAAADPGVPHGARAVGRAGVGAGRARPHPPVGRLHLVHLDAGAHRAHHARLRRGLQPGAVGHDRRLRRQLPRHAARRRRHRGPGHGGRDVGEEGPPPAALRVVAPHPPLRLPRRRPRAAPPAVDRHRLPVLHHRDRVLVEPVRPVRRCGARLPRLAADVALAAARRCASSTSGPRARASPR